jgi:hypothetical protein
MYVNKRKFADGEVPKLEFHIGASGTNKSRTVFAKYPDAYCLPIGNGGNSIWFDGYDGEEVIIINEYSGELPFNMIKQLCDWYPFSVQTKGGTVGIMAKTIVFTSTTGPEEWYPQDFKGEWKRRVAEFGTTYKYELEK